MAAMAKRALTLVLVLLALTTTIPATSDARVHVDEGGYIFAECHQAASNGSDAALRAVLHALLADLPSATDPTGFASVHSDNGAFARGFCFDDPPPSGGCAGCLAAAAKKIADECGGSRRAGAWNAGCFVACADSNASSPYEDAYRGRDFSTDGVTHPAFYDAHELAALALSLARRAADSSPGPMMATADMKTGRKGRVHAVAHCARDVTQADCARCLEKSSRELLNRGWAGLDGRHEGVAVVAGFSCHLRLEIHAPDLPFGRMLLKCIKENLAVIVLITLSAVAVSVFVIVMLRAFQQHVFI